MADLSGENLPKNEQTMTEIATNRDLYQAVADIAKRRAECRLPLQAYLENLWRLGQGLREREALSSEEFVELLQAAFEPASSTTESTATAANGYLDWEPLITQQIRDLCEMQAAGTLDNKYRYFGVDSPRGGRWYNFDPCTYLECAAAGTFDGWREGDDTGRSFVPGPVAVRSASGAITSVDPRDIDDPVVELPQITWEVFVDFLDAGQCYE